MIFPSVRAFPAAQLGKALLQWEHKPSYVKSLLIGGGIMAGFVALILFFFLSPEQFDFLRSYANILIYVAVPIISFLFGKLILMTRQKAYVLHERGFVVFYGELSDQDKAGNWAPWHDFDRAELQDEGVKIFPKKPLQQSFFFPCTQNRLNAYGIVSGQIAQHRYIPFDEAESQEQSKWD